MMTRWKIELRSFDRMYIPVSHDPEKVDRICHSLVSTGALLVQHDPCVFGYVFQTVVTRLVLAYPLMGQPWVFGCIDKFKEQLDWDESSETEP